MGRRPKKLARKEILFPKKTDMNVPLITLPNKTVRVKVVMAFLSAFADKAPIIIGIPYYNRNPEWVKSCNS